MKKNKENYLDNIPVISGDICWEEKDDLVIIKQVNKGLYNKLAQKFFGRPEISNIHLDEFGSFVWKQIDGEKNIGEIGQAVSQEFGKRAEPLYERLINYIYRLKDVKYITYRKLDK
ncbi:PqqD family protein [Eubacteriales bacterium KG127]